MFTEAVSYSGKLGIDAKVLISFVPKSDKTLILNDIFIRFVLPYDSHFHGQYLHDIELLDDSLEYMPHSALFSNSLISVHTHS